MAATILCVDDSNMIITQLRSCIEPEGYKFASATNGAEGLSVLRDQDKVDLLILDLNMPVMNGLEMLAEVRKEPKYVSLPAFILTTETSPALVSKGRELKATAWIVKPFMPAGLLAGIKKVLGSR